MYLLKRSISICRESALPALGLGMVNSNLALAIGIQDGVKAKRKCVFLAKPLWFGGRIARISTIQPDVGEIPWPRQGASPGPWS